MRQTVLIVMLALMLVLTGCGGGSSNQPSITNPFIGGNIAVNLALQDGAPPAAVYDGGKFQFSVGVVLVNVGEADIGPETENPYVTAKLEGIAPANFGVTLDDLHQTLEERVDGAKKNFDGTLIGGRTANFVFEGLNFQGKLVGNHVTTIRASVCYDYSNIATTMICMKDDIVENVQDSTLCTLNGVKPVYNSGGPIQITDVKQLLISKNKAQVSFQVAHVGGDIGEFYGRAEGEDCNPSIKNSNKYKVDLEITSQDPASTVKCNRLEQTGSGTLVMYGGASQVIICTIENDGEQTRVYTDLLTIKTKYRYGQFIEQPIVIQSVPQ
jgi:hypothetical protein